MRPFCDCIDVCAIDECTTVYVDRIGGSTFWQTLQQCLAGRVDGLNGARRSGGANDIADAVTECCID